MQYDRRQCTALLLFVAALIVSSCGRDKFSQAPESGAILRAWEPASSLAPLPPDTSGTHPGEALRVVTEVDPSAPHPEEITYDLDYDSTDIHQVLSATLSGSVLSTGLTNVHALATMRGNANEPMLIVAGTDSNGGVIQVYEDDEGDGIFESGELIESASEGSPPAGGVLYGWIVEAEGDVLVYDRRNYRILRIVDTDSDGIVDEFSATVVLDSTQSHEVAGTSAIDWDAEEDCVLLYEEGKLRVEPIQQVIRARDTDADGRVDEFSITSPTPPEDLDILAFSRTLVAGDTQLPIIGRQNSSIQVWRVDASSGADISLLGTVTHGVGQTTSSFNLSAGAVQGDAYRLKDTTHVLEGVVAEVGSSVGVKIYSISPRVIDSTSTTLITITGRGFDSSLELGVAPPCLPVQDGHEDLAFTLVSSEEISVQIPALTNASHGPGLLTLWDGSALVASAAVRWTIPQ